MYPTTDNPNQDVSVYPGISTGIDLRVEMDELLNTYGHWVMVRHYDTTSYSEFWNPLTHESVGGPPHPYTDHVVRSRKVLQTTGGVLAALDMPAPVGILNVPYITYYLKWDVVDEPLLNTDEIFEFPWDRIRVPGADEAAALINNKYSILESVDLLGDEGRREYYACICRADRVGW